LRKLIAPSCRVAPEELTLFNYDDLLLLLLYQQDGLTTSKENAFIKRALRWSCRARQLQRDIKETFPAEKRNSRQRSKKLALFLIPAALTITAVAGYQVVIKHSPPEIEWRTIKVENGMTVPVRLSDSSFIELNSGTILRYPSTFNRHDREVFIDGEAFITTGASSDRPLVVRTNHASVTVLGTSFHVSAYGDEFSTAVVEGAVLVTTGQGQQVKITTGHQAQLQQQTEQLIVTKFKIGSATGWRKGKYYFENKLFSDICKVIERTYNVRIVFDRGLINRHFTGVMYKKQHVSVILRNLSLSSGHQFYYDAEGAIHWR
jgi:ferric-dicitrate binding protein FerR (iron transport regulator)